MTLTEAAIEIRVSIDYVRKAVKRLAVASAVLTEAGDENRVDLLQVISSLEDECENLENVAGNVETSGWQNDKEYNISNTQTL